MHGIIFDLEYAGEWQLWRRLQPIFRVILSIRRRVDHVESIGKAGIRTRISL